MWIAKKATEGVVPHSLDSAGGRQEVARDKRKLIVCSAEKQDRGRGEKNTEKQLSVSNRC
jgi:hypothetical protein